jgi:hypothetical protein
MEKSGWFCWFLVVFLYFLAFFVENCAIFQKNWGQAQDNELCSISTGGQHEHQTIT